MPLSTAKASSSPHVWSCLSATKTLLCLEATEQGLSEHEALERKAKVGPNEFPKEKTSSLLIRWLRQFNNILIYVLLGAAVITGALGHLGDTLVILAVVIVNAAIGVYQEGKAEQAMTALRHLLALQATVIRAGKRARVAAEELVPGDIVLLEAGDKVPADLRLVQVDGLEVQEAILTGESLPVSKDISACSETTPLAEQHCMTFSGTLVMSGQARGVVVATGTKTELGRITGLLRNVKSLTTPLLEQMNQFARWITYFILSVALAMIAIGYVVERVPFVEMFMAVVALSVAAIPEGLPAVLTITLAVGVQAMARRHAIVRKLPAIETLGAVSVICSDKTGTLTQNKMMVADVVTTAERYKVSGDGYAPQGEITLKHGQVLARPDDLVELALAAAACNDAELSQAEGQWHVNGDAMEGALLAFAGKVMDTAASLEQLERLATLPFDAQYRYMATLHEFPEGCFFSVKGAPEQVISMCSHQLKTDGSAEPLTTEFWHEQANAMAHEGKRVLALARKACPQKLTTLKIENVNQGLTLLGLVGLIDPPRPESKAAVAECQAAGVQVKMITGDHRGTAEAIAQEIGLAHPDCVLTGADIDGMDDEMLAAAVSESSVFARTSPENKLRLVTALQGLGHIVAMTGDGVNDAPALKRADVGIAMGITGSEATKEVSDVVLADDNFASIVAAVREGRTVYDNIVKVISWSLPTSSGEALTIIVALLAGLTLPITPIQILWVNLVTSITLGLALAFEPSETNLMQRRPRERRRALLSGELVWHIILVSLLFLLGVFGIYRYAIAQDYPLELARTMALNTLVVMEIVHLLFIRNRHSPRLSWQAVRGTKVVWLTIACVTLAQLAVTYLSPLQAVFATASVAFADGLIILAIGALLFLAIECEKRLRLRRKA